MIFKDYRDILKRALRSHENDANSASAAIGIDPITFHSILSGANPDMLTTHMLLVYLSRQSCARSVS